MDRRDLRPSDQSKMDNRHKDRLELGEPVPGTLIEQLREKKFVQPPQHIPF